MSHQNGIISATDPVELIEDVKAVLEEETNDLGSLCRSSNVNPLAKNKPLKIQGTPNRGTDWWKADFLNNSNNWTNRCGFNIPHHDTDVPSGSWTYVKPTGGTYLYRLRDFSGYDHFARCPFSVRIPQYVYYELDNNNRLESVTGEVNLILTSVSSTELSLKDIFPNTQSKKWYFGVEVQMGNSQSAITLGSPLASQNTIPFDGCPILNREGNATVTVFLTQTQQAEWGGWIIGERYSLQAPEAEAMATMEIRQIPQNHYEFRVLGLVPEDREYLQYTSDPHWESGEVWCQARFRRTYLASYYNVAYAEVQIRRYYNEDARWEDVDYNVYYPSDTGVTMSPDYIDRDVAFMDYFYFSVEKAGAFELPSASAESYYTLGVTLHYEADRANVQIQEGGFDLVLGDAELDHDTCHAEILPDRIANTATWDCVEEYTYDPSDVCLLSPSADGKSCLITANQVGTCLVRCRTNATDIMNDQDAVYVNVTGEGQSSVRITSYPEELTTSGYGHTGRINADVFPTDTEVRWHTQSDNEIVQVDEYGRVTGVREGTDTVYCNAVTGGGFDSCEIRVVGSGGGGGVTISVSPTTMTLYEYQSAPITATVSTGSVTWNSSDSSVATTNLQTGFNVNVVAGVLPAGQTSSTVYITASSKAHPEYTATCTVTVLKASQPVIVDSISLNATERTIFNEDTFLLVATVLDEDGNNAGGVKWYTTDNNIRLDTSTGRVTGISPGNARVYAETIGVDENGNHLTANCLFHVKQHVNSLRINESNMTISVEQSVKYTTSIEPNDASFDAKDVQWEASNGHVQIQKITDYSQGYGCVVTGLSVGQTDITASVDTPARSDSRTVTVISGTEIHIYSVFIEEGDFTMDYGSQGQLTCTTDPEDAQGFVTSYSWSIISGSDKVRLQKTTSRICRIIAGDERGRAEIQVVAVGEGSTFTATVTVNVGNEQI